jgi:hypothetical protein
MSRDNVAITSQPRGQTSPQRKLRRPTKATPSATGHPIAVFLIMPISAANIQVAGQWSL